MKTTVCEALTISEKCGCGTLYVHITHENKVMKEVRMHLGKQGTCPRVLCDALTNLINIMLGHDDILMKDIIEAVNNHSCEKKIKNKNGGTTRSCADCIAQALKEAENEYGIKKI